MVCEMCGAQGKLYRTIVEGAELSLCQECSNFGKVIRIVEQKPLIGKPQKKTMGIEPPEQKAMEILVEDYAKKIREKRQSMGLSQEEFAKKINEKESLVQKIESGHFEPSIGLAKKIGSFLKVKLVEEYEERHESIAHSKTDSFTIGDFIKVRGK